MDLINKQIGDIDKASKNSLINEFRRRPIGLANKSYEYMLDHLYRNIGNAEYTYDGFGTPIGDMANPFYDSVVRVPWFFQDEYKNSTSNYIDYIKEIYGSTLSVENINTFDAFNISDYVSRIGAVDTYVVKEALYDNDMAYSGLINPNFYGTDTYLGETSSYYLTQTLRNSIIKGDERRIITSPITDLLKETLGLSTPSVLEEDITNVSYRLDPQTGRFETFSPLSIDASPVYNKNFGLYGVLGAYEAFYQSLGYNSKGYYKNSVRTPENKFYPSFDGDEGNTYLDNNKILVDFDKNINEQSIRYAFATLDNHSNLIDALNGGQYIYAEAENGVAPDVNKTDGNIGVRFHTYKSYSDGLTVDDLLKKTNDSFINAKYKTIISRFHTDVQDTNDLTQTAISKQYGMSHGRNLLKTKMDKDSEGYENPYCRVWTYHHQYHSLKDAIRPFEQTTDDLLGTYNFTAFTADRSDSGFVNGRKRLDEHGVLNRSNGLVNITPVEDSAKKVDIRNCMFSIENLAWKDTFKTDKSSREAFDENGLSPEQKGPFGGRIMWFPPYDIKFNEDVNVSWNENNFIGRGEPIYTYANTTRTGTLDFKILVDHPSIIDYWEGRHRTSNGDTVDDIDSPEQQLLRFFAGCDMLKAGPTSTTDSEPEPVVTDPEIPKPKTKVLKFFVFYPNNYTGVDDDPEFAMAYLTNGLGAGVVKDSPTGKTVNYKIPYALADNKYGGYEMRYKKPISIVTAQTDGDLHIADTKVGNTNVSLYVIEGDSTNEWWKRKWYYRVDTRVVKPDKFTLKNHKLRKESYIDRESYQLNAHNGRKKVITEFGIKEPENLYSLADVYAALGGSEVESVLSGCYNPSKVSSFKRDIESYDIDHVECVGRASKQGYSDVNERLKIYRAQTVEKWLKTKGKFKGGSVKFESKRGESGGIAPGVNVGKESELKNKIWRCAEVNIYLKTESSDNISNTTVEHDTSLGGESKIVTYVKGTTRNVLSSIDGYKPNGIANFYDSSTNRYTDKVIQDINTNSYYNLIKTAENIESPFLNEKFKKTTPNALNSVNKMVTEMGSLNNLETSAVERAETDAIKSTPKGMRYDNESKFFELLKREEPFLHHKISDKIKYFDPAFHSISPEGFNARLTFLHQCTRQGPTVGASDVNSMTANNLSFGRPPVCILRIGDFYYTKIIIRGLSITFDPLVWDLNAEGIGVMPMIANVTLRFDFIGGSSLAGHITRLQNALSFNYYANTEVYDNRSELAQYNENGDLTKFAPYNPTLNKK